MFVLVVFILLGVPLESGLRHEGRLTRRNLDSHTFVWAYGNRSALSNMPLRPPPLRDCETHPRTS